MSYQLWANHLYEPSPSKAQGNSGGRKNVRVGGEEESCENLTSRCAMALPHMGSQELWLSTQVQRKGKPVKTPAWMGKSPPEAEPLAKELLPVYDS